MSPLDIQRLSAISPATGVSAGHKALTGAVGSGAQDTPSAAQRGVRVEVSGAVSAGGPPVDNDRVAEIRAALQDGSYPVVPTEIADALIAARLMLGYGE